MRRALSILGILIALVLLLGVGAWFGRFELLRMREGLPAFTHAAGPSTQHRVAMPDGIELATEVYTPADGGPWPTVLIRNPYQGFDFFVRDWCGRLVRYGYACVYQDVRGQGASEGEWEPLVNEPDDGSATLRWIVGQDFQDGHIGMIGPSYLAAVQWAAAGDLPPEVKTFVPTVFTTDTYGVLYQDGMFRHETFTAWAALMQGRGMVGDGAGASYAQAVRHRPHREVDEAVFGTPMPWYREWVDHPSPSDPLWRRADNQRLNATPGRLEIPILMIGGWYDVFIGPQLGDWSRLATQAQSRLIVGPWTHVGSGSEAFPPGEGSGDLFQWARVLDWLGHHLKGTPLAEAPGVTSYDPRAERWTNRPAWPPPARAWRLHLADGISATGCEGGALLDAPGSERDVVRYAYDPSDPVPTRGGAGMLAFVLPDFGGAPPGTTWQEGFCERDDVLSFISEPVDADMTLAGTIDVRLTVASSAEDTAFTAKLMEVLPDGRAVNIRDGITTLAYRNGATSPQPYLPEVPVAVDFSLWPIEWTIPAGSRLRLDISSSDFPKFHAHPNLAGPWASQDSAIVADQALFVGQGRSWIELPVETIDP